MMQDPFFWVPVVRNLFSVQFVHLSYKFVQFRTTSHSFVHFRTVSYSYFGDSENLRKSLNFCENRRKNCLYIFLKSLWVNRHNQGISLTYRLGFLQYGSQDVRDKNLPHRAKYVLLIGSSHRPGP
jgi:hypothetical protein